MILRMSLRQEKIKFAAIFGIITFSTVFLLTGSILSVFGLTVNDAGYKAYFTEEGIPNTPYQDMMVNACLTKPLTETDTTMVLDSKGLRELGMPPIIEGFTSESCLDMAQNIAQAGWVIDEMTVDENKDMKIVLTKK